MKILALDISTKPGWAFFVDGELNSYGTIFAEKHTPDFGEYPWNYLGLAEHVAREVYSKVTEFGPEHVVIEESTAGKLNYSQKILEFLHYCILKSLQGLVPVSYVRDGVWKRIVGAVQNNEEKKLNARIRKIKKETGSKLAKIDGKVVGKRTRKHYAIRAFSEHFGIQLRRMDEDACDAALLGLAFIKGAPVCNGRPDGGTSKK